LLSLFISCSLSLLVMSRRYQYVTIYTIERLIGFCSKRLRKTTKNISHDRWCFDRESNRANIALHCVTRLEKAFFSHRRENLGSHSSCLLPSARFILCGPSDEAVRTPLPYLPPWSTTQPSLCNLTLFSATLVRHSIYIIYAYPCIVISVNVFTFSRNFTFPLIFHFIFIIIIYYYIIF
jgi:hypothetical protein